MDSEVQYGLVIHIDQKLYKLSLLIELYDRFQLK